MTAFDKLSDEGKMQKLLHHLDVNMGPVPAPWVRWLLDNADRVNVHLKDEKGGAA